MPRRPSTDTTIGERIRERRSLRGWSIRYAASRAGISHATWSRIEGGLQSADNRFVVADIAAALECSVAELVGVTGPATRDRQLVTARASVASIREALIETDSDEAPTVEAPPLAALEHEAALVGGLFLKCDYAGAGRRLPELIRHLHAAAAGPDRAGALRLMAHTGRWAADACKFIGYPAEAWLAAEWTRGAAQRLADPVMTGYAAFQRAIAAWECGAYRRAHSLASRAADDVSAHAGATHAVEILGMLLLTSAHTAYATRRPDDGAAYYAEAGRLAGRTGETRTFDLFFGPTNVAFWQINSLADGGDPDAAVRVALGTNPGVLAVPSRQVFFYLHSACALTRVGHHSDASRYMLIAERLAPQLVHASPLAAETARGLRDRVGGSQLRGLCERMGLPS